MYKDKEKQLASWRRYFHRNKAAFRLRRIQKRRKLRDFVNSLKRGPCVDCGGHFPPEAMDFDHVRGDKVAGISTLVGNIMAAALSKELLKCELICANCHRVRTAKK